MLDIIAFHCLLHTNLIFLLQKAFTHCFSVQIIAKMVIFFYLFHDILVAILKGAYM